MAAPADSTLGDDVLRGVRAAFTHACAAEPGQVDRIDLRFGGRPVVATVAGTELARQIRQAFATLVADDSTNDPALTLGLWDRTATGIGCPGTPHVPDSTEVLGPGLVSQYDHGRVLRHDRATEVSVLDRATGSLFGCVTDASRTGLNDRAKPFPHLLASWWFDQGGLVTHAGAVAHRGRAVLVGGPAGAGKSTTAVACALAGFDVLGDDAVAVEPGPEAILAHACYSSVRLHPEARDRFPVLDTVGLDPIGADDGTKLLAALTDLGRPNPATTAPLAAIVVPSVDGTGPSRLVELERSVALRAIGPSTLLRGLGAGAAGLARLSAVIRQLPCRRLVLGADVSDVPALLDGLLDGARV